MAWALTCVADKKSLRALVSCGTLLLASLCSGLDVVVLVAHCLALACHGLGIPVNWKHELSCELDDEKRALLLRRPPFATVGAAGHLFSDVTHLAEGALFAIS